MAWSTQRLAEIISLKGGGRARSRGFVPARARGFGDTNEETTRNETKRHDTKRHDTTRHEQADKEGGC